MSCEHREIEKQPDQSSDGTLQEQVGIAVTILAIQCSFFNGLITWALLGRRYTREIDKVTECSVQERAFITPSGLSFALEERQLHLP